MKPAEEKSCTNFEFPKGNGGNKVSRNRGMILHTHPKSTPSKWDDAQKWLAGLSGGGSHSHSKAKPRNSNADDRRLLNSASQRERYSCSSAEGLVEEMRLALSIQDESETKKIDCNGSHWKVNKPVNDSSLVIRSVCVRDMGTEMTPTASQEPSRTATPIRASTPVLRSPISSRSSTPGRGRQVSQPSDNYQQMIKNSDSNGEAVLYGVANGNDCSTQGNGELCDYNNMENSTPKQVSNPSSLESRAMAWDEAERAKYIARYRREEVKIQAWENNEKRKAETAMKRKEEKAERMKTRAQTKMANKLAETQRIVEEKRVIAEAKLNKQAAKTTERADYIRTTGHLPSSFFSFKLPSLCGESSALGRMKRMLN